MNYCARKFPTRWKLRMRLTTNCAICGGFWHHKPRTESIPLLYEKEKLMNSGTAPFRNCPRCAAVLKSWTSGSVHGQFMTEQAERGEAKKGVVASASPGRGEGSGASRSRTQKTQ